MIYGLDKLPSPLVTSALEFIETTGRTPLLLAAVLSLKPLAALKELEEARPPEKY